MDPEDRVRRLGRYVIVSVGSAILGEGFLGLFVGVWQWPAALANVVAASIGLGPAYLASRYWVWRPRGSASVVREALSFWVISLTGVALSTIAAGGTGAWAHGLHLSRAADTTVVLAAVLCSYGVLWLIRFFVLDVLVFRNRPRAR